MPTTLPLRMPAANAMNRREKIPAFRGNPDLIVVTIFSAIGLLVAIMFAVYLPLSDDLVALLR